MDDTEMDYYDFDDMNKEEDEQVELDMQQYFCEITLRSKDAPYDGYDESDDTEDKARSVLLKRVVPVIP